MWGFNDTLNLPRQEAPFEMIPSSTHTRTLTMLLALHCYRNCLFRALSDQLHDGHTNHVHIRRSVVRYMREHREDFAPFVEDNVSFEDHGEQTACACRPTLAKS